MYRHSLFFLIVINAVAGSTMSADNALTDQELAQKGKASTVLIELSGGKGFGSAFCVDAQGFFITNCHVVSDAGESITLVASPGEESQRK